MPLHAQVLLGLPGVFFAILAAMARVLAEPPAERGDLGFLAARAATAARAPAAVRAMVSTRGSTAVTAQVNSRQFVAHGRGEVPAVFRRPGAEGRGYPDPRDGLDRNGEIS